MKRQHLIYLIAGIVLTVLFYVMRVNAYEAVYAVSGFSDQLYNLGLYETIPLITIAVAWAMAGIYYYAINSVRFDRWYHWLVMLALVVLIAPIAGYAVNSHVFDENGLSYATESLTFEMVNMMWAAVLFVVASFSMRWWSTNCRHTPIPQ